MPRQDPPGDGRFFVSREPVRFRVSRNDGGRQKIKPQPSALPIPRHTASQHFLEACRTSQKGPQLGDYPMRPGDILSRFAGLSRKLKEDDAHGRTSGARAQFISKVTTMANVASAPPGKLKESVQAKTASSPKPVAQPKTVAQPRPVVQPRPVAQPRPVVQPRPVAQPRPATPVAPVAASRGVTPTKPIAPIKANSPAKPRASSFAVPPKPVPRPPAESKSAETSIDERASALAFLGSLAQEVSKGTVSLPCFPDVVMRIRKALAEPDVGLTEIVKIVG